MTKATKQLVESVITKIQGPAHCYMCCHEILIGDVLEKIAQVKIGDYRGRNFILLDIWQKCGFSRSLQQIVEYSGWERTCEQYTCNHAKSEHYHLKSPEASELFLFLAEIFNPTIR